MCVSEPIVAHEAASFVETVRLSMLVAMTLLRVMDHIRITVCEVIVN